MYNIMHVSIANNIIHLPGTTYPNTARNDMSNNGRRSGDDSAAVHKHPNMMGFCNNSLRSLIGQHG